MMSQIIRFGTFSNGYFVVEGENVVMVDSGMQPAGDFMAICEKNDINPKSIKLIIITHGHEDHFSFADQIKEATGAPLMCHQLAAESLRLGLKPQVVPRNYVGEIARKAGERMEKEFLEHPEKMPPRREISKVKPDIIIDGGCNLADWGIHGRIIYTPGHSQGDISIVLDDRQALVGDLIVTEPDSQLSTIAMYSYRADNDEECADSVNRLLQCADIFYSGHGGPFTAEQVRQMLDKGYIKI